MTRVLPGLSLAVATALTALLAAEHLLPPTVGPVLASVVIGLLIGNAITLPASTRVGLGFAMKRVLRVGVMLLGARLTLDAVASIGGSILGVVVVCMMVALVGVGVFSKMARIPARLAVLIAVGTAICGNSAIMATAPIIEAEEQEISFAVATITIFGTLALILFPLFASIVDMPDRMFGLWAGLAINDTSQVVAAGASYSSEALEVATVVKLTRNLFIAPVIMILAWWSATPRGRSTTGATEAPSDIGGSVLRTFPLFLLGFLGLAVLRSIGVLGDELAARLGSWSVAFIAVAIAAVGLTTRISDLRKIGPRPFIVGFAAAASLSAIALVLSSWL